MNAVILEDEILASKRLKRMIQEVNKEVVIEEAFISIRDLAEYLLSVDRHPDILFLDIHVLDGVSLELFELMEIKSKIIFTTAYDEYAIKAFRHNATDYLLKPIKKEELQVAIQKAQPQKLEQLPQLRKEPYKKRILIKFGSKLYGIPTDEIAYIYSENKIAYFYDFNGKRTPSDYKLQTLEKLLDPEIFFRANRQFILSFPSIKSIKTHNASRLKITLDPPIDQQLVISTEKTRKFKSWMDR